MLTATRAKGGTGESLFFYEALRANSDRLGTYLQTHFYQTPAIPPYRDGKRWIPRGTIVNETDGGAVSTGVWSVYPMKGYEGAITRTNDTLHYTAIRYNVVVADAGYYDVYTFRTPNTPWTQHAVYTVRSDTDSTTVLVDQSDLAKKGWYKLGTVFLSAGTKPVVTVDNSMLEPGRYLVSDAVMIMLNRRLSPEVLITDAAATTVAPSTPDGFALEGNYPNPFNPRTTICFAIGAGVASGGNGEHSQGRGTPGTTRTASGWVRLTVHDLLGREVAVLVDEPLQPGMYEIPFDATGLATGVYFSTLAAGGQRQTRPMILVK
jgi:hypothetical protein